MIHAYEQEFSVIGFQCGTADILVKVEEVDGLVIDISAERCKATGMSIKSGENYKIKLL